MKKFLFFIVLTSLMSGCAVSYDPSTSSKSTPVDFPPLGQVNTAYVGDSMMSKGILVEGEAIVLKNAIDGVAYDIPSGTYDKLGKGRTSGSHLHHELFVRI